MKSLIFLSPIVIPIKRRFVPKHNPHPFRVLRAFLELWEALEDDKDGRCNMELIAGTGKLEKTRFGTLLEQEAWRA